MTTKATNKFSPEVRGRAVRMVQEHTSQHPTHWAAVQPVAAEIGCAAHTLHDWTRKAEVDGGKRAGMPAEVAERLRALKRENRELRQAYEALRQVWHQLRREAVGLATLERVDWFNNRRLLEPIGNIPPAEAEANYHAALDDRPMAAQHSNQDASGKPSAIHATESSAWQCDVNVYL